MGELGTHVLVEQVQAARVEPLKVLVERVDEYRERKITLELRRRAGENEVPTCLGAPRELGVQAGLPDAELAHQLNRARPTLVELGKLFLE